MRSLNHFTLSGKVVSLSNPLPDTSVTRFTLLHPFGGGKPPLLLYCTTPLDVIIKAKDNLTVSGYLKGNKTPGKIEAYITNVSLNNK